MSRGRAEREKRAIDDRAGVAGALYGLVAGAARRVPRDISLTSLSTMSTLERTGPRRVTDLAATEGVTQPSMTALVTALERSGLVERRRDPSDKRVALVALTMDGWDQLRARRQAGAETMARLIDKLGPEDVAALAAAVPALDRLRQLDDEQRDRGPLSYDDGRPQQSDPIPGAPADDGVRP